MDTLSPRDRVVFGFVLLVACGGTIVVFRSFEFSGNAFIGITGVVGITALFIVTRWHRRRLAAGTAAAPLASASCVVAGEPGAVRARLFTFLRQTPRWEPVAGTAGEVLQIKTGMTFRSFGETIEIRLNPAAEGRTRVEITSSSTMPTTMADYGKNRANVARILRFLDADGFKEDSAL